MFKTILLGVDGSEHALKAARVAGEMARCMQANVWVVAHASCPVLLVR